MAGYEYSFSALCENCKTEFTKHMMLYSSLSVDADSALVKDFLNDRLNVVVCPHCGKSFVYERPFVAYSIAGRYAILADASAGGHSKIMGRARLYDMFALDMKFRLVDFMCEVSEKVRIFNDGLDDREINRIKRLAFDESYFADKREAMVLFEKFEDGDMIFVYKDYLGNELERRRISLDQYHNSGDDDICVCDKEILWKFVN